MRAGVRIPLPRPKSSLEEAKQNMSDIYDIAWCPIDISPFPYPYMDLDKDRNWFGWHSRLLGEDTGMIDSDVLAQYPLLENWIRQFPYTKIIRSRFSTQEGSIDPHLDITSQCKQPGMREMFEENEPCGYRILVRGRRHGTLYIMKDGEKIYPRLPDDTDVYVLRHTETMHGVEHEPGRATFYLQFWIESAAHYQLLSRSYDRYKQYAIMA